MTPERQARIDAAIAALLAQGFPITKAAVYRGAGGNKLVLSRYMDAWYVAHPEATAAVAVLELQDAGPDDADAYPQGAACRLTDGLPEAPPARRSDEPRLMALARERREAQLAVEQASRRAQEASAAYQLGVVSARGALARLREASRRARMAPAHELGAAFAAVTAAREGLAWYVGGAEAAMAEQNLGYGLGHITVDTCGNLQFHIFLLA